MNAKIQNNLAKLVAKTWADENFRASFFAEPVAFLREAGMILQEGAKVIINEGASSSAVLAEANTGATVYELFLPSKPDDLDAELLYAWFDKSFGFVPSNSSGNSQANFIIAVSC